MTTTKMKENDRKERRLHKKEYKKELLHKHSSAFPKNSKQKEKFSVLFSLWVSRMKGFFRWCMTSLRRTDIRTDIRTDTMCVTVSPVIPMMIRCSRSESRGIRPREIWRYLSGDLLHSVFTGMLSDIISLTRDRSCLSTGMLIQDIRSRIVSTGKQVSLGKRFTLTLAL